MKKLQANRLSVVHSGSLMPKVKPAPVEAPETQSVRLGYYEWESLRDISQREQISIGEMIELIRHHKPEKRALLSAIRLYTITYYSTYARLSGLIIPPIGREKLFKQLAEAKWRERLYYKNLEVTVYLHKRSQRRGDR